MTKCNFVSASEWKAEGNKYFKSEEFEDALNCYTKALDFAKDKKEKLPYYKNRAACYLKLVSIYSVFFYFADIQIMFN